MISLRAASSRAPVACDEAACEPTTLSTTPPSRSSSLSISHRRERMPDSESTGPRATRYRTCRTSETSATPPRPISTETRRAVYTASAERSTRLPPRRAATASSCEASGRWCTKRMATGALGVSAARPGASASHGSASATTRTASFIFLARRNLLPHRSGRNLQ
eukprot:6017690-Prymnesium_polylepis.1